MVDSGLWGFCLLLQVVMNLDYGPWDGSAFFVKAQEANKKLMVSGGVQQPLVRHFWTDILQDIGAWDRRHDEGIEEDVGDKLKHCFDAKSERVSMNRWMALVRSAEAYLPLWHCRLVVYLFLCLAEGHSAQVLKPLQALVKDSHLETGEAMVSGTKKQGEQMARNVRKNCKNTLHLGARFLLSDEAHRLTSMLVLFSQPTADWHGRQNKANRSPQACREYYLEQACWQGLEHLNETWLKLKDPAVLSPAGMIMDSTCKAWLEAAEDTPMMLEQDRFAHLAGNHVMNIVANRLKTVLQHTMAFPLSFAALLSPDDAVVTRQLLYMKECYNAWQKAVNSANKTEDLRKLLERSWFHHQLVRIIFALALAADWQTPLCSCLHAILEDLFCGIGQTKVVEDGNKVVSLASEGSASKRLGARTKWQRLINSNVLQVLHHFHTLDGKASSLPPAAEAAAKREPVPLSAHTMRLKKASDPSITAYAGAGDPTWPSFTAASITKLEGDQQVLCGVASPAMVAKSWHACFFQPGFLVKPTDGDTWRLVIARHWGNCALLWPLRRYVFKGQVFYFPKAGTPTETYLLPVSDMNSWSMQEVQFWPPMHMACFGNEAPAGVVLVPEGKPTSVLAMAASKAFWTLSETFLLSLSEERGWNLSGGLMSVVKGAIQKVLGDMEEEELYEILLQRSYPASVYDNSWMTDQAILSELDSATLKEVEVPLSVAQLPPCSFCLVVSPFSSACVFYLLCRLVLDTQFAVPASFSLQFRSRPPCAVRTNIVT